MNVDLRPGGSLGCGPSGGAKGAGGAQVVEQSDIPSNPCGGVLQPLPFKDRRRGDVIASAAGASPEGASFDSSRCSVSDAVCKSSWCSLGRATVNLISGAAERSGNASVGRRSYPLPPVPPAPRCSMRSSAAVRTVMRT